MTQFPFAHWPFVFGAYGATLAMGGFLCVSAATRLRRARRLLATVEGRAP